MYLFLNVIYGLLIAISVFLIFFNLPGTFFIAGLNILYQLVDKTEEIDWRIFWILIAIAAVAEILEYAVMVWSSNRYGASKQGTVAAIIGSIIGAIVFSGIMPVIGTIIGAFGGAFVGAYISELMLRKSSGHAFRAGFGAMAGVAGGKTLKFAAAIAMIIVMI